MPTAHRIVALLSLCLPCSCGLGTAAVAGAVGDDGGGGPGQTPPSVLLDSTAFAVIPDERFGMLIPFRVSDPDGDPVRVVFQWRRSDEAFAPLPETAVELETLLADPDQRAIKQIAGEYRSAASGEPLAVDSDDQLRLPELGLGSAPLPELGVLGRDLELLRKPGILVDPALEWGSGAVALSSTAGVAPIGDGIEAYVLDQGGEGWRVRRIALATGRPVGAVVASSTGTPAALALAGDGRLLVGGQDQGGWFLDRVEPANPDDVERLAAGDGTLRAIAAFGADATLATIGNRLVRIDHAPGAAASVADVLPGTLLKGARGLALDPLRAGRVYLAERDWDGATTTGRVLRVDVASATYDVVPAFEAGSTSGEPDGLPRPSSIALERGGSRLLAIVDGGPSGPPFELRALELGAGTRARVRTIAALDEPAASLSTGPDELRVLALATSGALRVAGGIEQRRKVGEVSPSGQVVRVAPAFEPAVFTAAQASRRGWRIGGIPETYLGTAGGLDDVFVWDAGVVTGGATVAMRALAYDARQGPASATGPTRLVRDAADALPRRLAAPEGSIRAVECADLDGDGDLDVVAAAHRASPTGKSDDGAVHVWLQGRPGDFGTVDGPSFSFGDTLTVRHPNAVRAADLDRDGLADLVVANGNPGAGFPPGNYLAVYRQDAGDGFAGFVGASEPTWIAGGTATTFDPYSVAVADLNGDGRPDLMSANRLGSKLAVFYQRPNGGFGAGAQPSAPDLQLGSPAATAFPMCVVAADFDRDGRVDLACANFLGGSVALFRQLPSAAGAIPGAFAPALELDGGGGISFPSSVAAVDADEDGDLDLVVGHHPRPDEPEALLLLQASDGSFSAGAATSAHPAFGCGADGPPADVLLDVVPADLDGDGDLDLASRSLEGATVRYQTAPGAFAASVCLAGSGDALAYGDELARMPILARELDGDGALDLVTASENEVLVYLRAGPGSFPPVADLALGPAFAPGQPPAGRQASLSIGDLDADQRLDIAAAHPLLPVVRGFTQSAPAQLTLSQVLGGAASTSAPNSTVVLDLDRDGLDDVLVANGGVQVDVPGQEATVGDEVFRFAQSLPAVFGEAGDPTEPSLPPLSLPGASGDLIAYALDLLDAVSDPADDGLSDVVVLERAPPRVSVFRQASAGAFAAPVVVPLEAAGGTVGPAAIAFGDVVDLAGAADDGLVDLVVADEAGDRVLAYARTGGASFAALPSLTLGSAPALDAPRGLVVRDLDGDGRADVVSANAGNLTVFLRSPDGGFGPGSPAAPSLTLAEARDFVSSGDLDGDGDLDLAGGGTGISLYLQTTPGGFGVDDGGPTRRPHRTIAQSAVDALALVDLDQDRDLDLVSAQASGVLVAVRFGSH